jgi:hypothetical protein
MPAALVGLSVRKVFDTLINVEPTMTVAAYLQGPGLACEKKAAVLRSFQDIMVVVYVQLYCLMQLGEKFLNFLC